MALMAAALDDRVAGAAVVAAFSPWRASSSQYESLRTWSHLHGFLPRLGWYANRPEQAPVDFAGILSCIAPRPLMIIAPALDRYSDMKAVKETMQRVKSLYELYGMPAQPVFRDPAEINRITMPMLHEIVSFYRQN